MIDMPAYEERLKNGLMMRSVRNEQDIERYAVFHEKLFHDRSSITCGLLLRHHPLISYDDFLFVEDPQTGEIVSTVCLVPWQCRYEELTLEVAQMEFVATHPEYRHKGLIRAQIDRFHQMGNERKFHLYVVGGIRYYYRRFGYTYAVDAQEKNRGDPLPAWMIPELPSADAAHHRLRSATPEDAPVLRQFYQKAMASVHFHDQRNEEVWRYMLQWSQFPVRILVDTRDNRSLGYLSTTCLENDVGIQIEESAIFDNETATAVLHLLKKETKGEIFFGGPENSILMRIGRSLGTSRSPRYAWQIRIVDVPRLLHAIAPVLERRLAASLYAGLSAGFRLNLFDEAYSMVFEKGTLRRVDPLGFVDTSYPYRADAGEVQIPPDAFVRLVLGYRNLHELSDAWPDIRIRPEFRLLVEVLFPRMESYLSLPYSYRGPMPASPSKR